MPGWRGAAGLAPAWSKRAREDRNVTEDRGGRRGVGVREEDAAGLGSIARACVRACMRPCGCECAHVVAAAVDEMAANDVLTAEAPAFELDSPHYESHVLVFESDTACSIKHLENARHRLAPI